MYYHGLKYSVTEADQLTIVSRPHIFQVPNPIKAVSMFMRRSTYLKRQSLNRELSASMETRTLSTGQELAWYSEDSANTWPVVHTFNHQPGFWFWESECDEGHI